MARTGLVIDSRYLEHRTPPGHPERPERLQALIEMLETYSREGIRRFDARAATREEILRVHDASYFDFLAEAAGKRDFAFDADTFISTGSFEAALLSAGGFLSIVEAIMNDEADNGFGLVRPPGHHAETDRAMGFCLFNNVAVAAHFLLEEYDVERILIVDWDVHHGNGTQWSFYADPRVLYISTHHYPFYPGTGSAEQVGMDRGLGFTVNIPLHGGGGDAEYLAAFSQIIAPISKQFDPRFILVSAGFDAHSRDPLGGMKVTEEGYATMARILLDIAEEHAGGRLAAVLEGGYALEPLQNCVKAVLEEMGKKKAGEIESLSAPDAGIFTGVLGVQKKYWDL